MEITKNKIAELVDRGVIVSHTLFRTTDDIDDDILIQASQMLEANETIIEDDILIQASQMFEPANRQTKVEPACSSTRFGCPQSSSDLKEIKDAGVPYRTKQSTQWATNEWKDWSKARSIHIDESEHAYPLSEVFSDMTLHSIAFWLPRFTVETRKTNGELYPPNSLNGLCCGLQRNLRCNDRCDINFFTDSKFFLFCEVLDS